MITKDYDVFKRISFVLKVYYSITVQSNHCLPKIRPYYVAQVGLDLIIFWLLLSECGDYRHASLQLPNHCAQGYL